MYFNNNFSELQKYKIDSTLRGNVYRIDKRLTKKLKDSVVYFTSENINTEVNLYAFTKLEDFYIGLKKYSSCSKCLIWKEQGSSIKGMMEFIFDYILPDFEIVCSDSMYTTLGEDNLDRVIKYALSSSKYKVGICKGYDTLEFDRYLTSYQDYLQSKEQCFGDKSEYEYYRYFIQNV